MIERLRISQLALVDELEIEFGRGLNVLTGETGAGKSIVLSALGLLAGARPKPGSVRDGADGAVVEAVFRTEQLPALRAALEARGLADESGELIVRRTLAADGRSRAWVGGSLVPIATLAELFEAQLEISSQHGSQALLRGETQGLLLDAFGELLDLRALVERGVRELREREAEIARLRAEAEERARRADYLAFQVREIDEVGVEPAAVAALERDHARLVHAERLREDAARAAHALTGDPAQGDAPAAADLASDAERSIAALAKLDAGLTPLAERLAALRAEAQDVARELDRYAAAIDVDPEQLAALDERIRALEKLRRKYGRSAEEIVQHRERAAVELAALAGSDDRMRKLEAERAAAEQALAREVAKLSAGRAKAAKALAREAQRAIRELALPGARFEVALTPVPGGLGASGAESAELLFSANAGEALRPLRSVASGGELSRVFLALKNTLRRASAGMVLVFDEVDAGVGGAVAERVGATLASLASQHQVLCITHLPQIAAHADAHFAVRKREAAGRTVTGVEPLGAAERVDEIARMAGGERVTEATRKHARALLMAARGGKSGKPIL
ncbi:MAG TPA: DNA repair protein RecN [Myxococcota bacterium]|nr:DNA repair protein RecN [Myxococcota bacterium]